MSAARYEFSYQQLFNIFGAPGIPNTYEAVLYRNGRVFKTERFHFRSKAERQCRRWKELYDATPR